MSHGLSTERKAQAGFALTLVCLGLIGSISYRSVNRLREDAEWSRHTEEVISSLRYLLSQVTDAETSQRGYAITGEESYLEPYYESQRGIGTNLQSLRKLTADNAVQQRRLDAMVPLVAKRITLLGEWVDLRRSQGFAAAQAAIATGAGKQLHDQIRKLVGEMVTAEQGLLQQRQVYAKRSSEMAMAIIVGGSILALGIVAVALFSIGKDFARRRAQAAQAELAGRLGHLGAWTVELPGFKPTWSDEVYAIHEMQPGTAVTVEKAINCYAPEFRETITEAFGACVRDGTPYDVELQIITAKGRRVWVRSIGEAERNAVGVIRRVQGALQDISERKQGVEALRESEIRFRELAENIEEVFWVADPEKLQKLYISPAYEKIWGRTCQSAYESPHMWLEAIRPEDRDRVLQALRTKQTQGAYDEEYRIIRPDRTERWIHDRAFPVRDTSGAIKRWVGVAADITEYRAMEEQLRQTQKMEAIGTLAGGIAHDFNNILASVNGYTELARLSLKENPEVREYLGAVLQASSRATDLVRQILTFSRQQRVDRQPIQLRPVVAETLKLLRATIPSTIEFDISLATDAPTVLADATQIHQILMNLGTNAWHAMKDHAGRFQVRLERCVVDAAHAATHSRLRSGVYARMSVSDTGCGMDQATQRRIFEPFFTTKPPGEGTGLGLAVVHGIMDTHDGAVTVYSQPGEGTVFHLYFPAHAGEATLVATDEAPTPSGHGERILFVDDEELLVRLGQKTLTALGYEVEVAIQPATALAMVRADPQRFALVLTDQTMPGMTGLFLAMQLRQIQPGLPVILMTGYSLSLPSERVEAAGICQLLLKPTNIHSLGVAVHAALALQPTH